MKLRDLFRPKTKEFPQGVVSPMRQTAMLHAEERPTEASGDPHAQVRDKADWASLNADASTALQAGRLDEAIHRYSGLIELQPDFAEGHYKRGNAFNRLGRWSEALTDYDRAVELDPGYANAFCNRGSVLERLDRPEDALVSYERAITINPQDAFAYYNRAGLLKELNRLDEALGSYDQAIALNHGYAEAYVNRGHLLHKLARLEEAATSYGCALELRPMPTHFLQDGQQAILGSEQKYLLGLRRHVRMQICDWRDMEEDLGLLARGLEAHLPVCLPFAAMALLDSPSLHRAAAESWIREESPPNTALGPIPARPASAKIRIGYFSADFRSHPVSLLAARLFECHDRSRFEVTAFSFGPESNDAMQARLTKAFDRFIDVRRRSDLEVAALAREIGIDIAVDLNGITEHCRSNIFALRAAPIQVNYLGYPGTMGAGYMDYLIGDRTVIPPAHRVHYAEKIIYLPDSFIPFDSGYAIADKIFTREELGLQRHGFVFCCFNNAHKITPSIFESWMKILMRTEPSVLWLPQANSIAVGNLRKEAARRGVDPERLIFAERWASLPEHLARLRAADLFLDTLPYNAHATSLDALWAGLPLLTCEGQGFAGRVAASLLRTIGLPQLITASLSEYEDMATALAADPERLLGIRQQLAGNRSTTALFDTERYTKNLEAAYQQIHERYHSGAAPAHINEPVDR